MVQSYRRGLTAAQKTELWDRWQRGESLKAIGRAFGKPSSPIYRLVSPHGGITARYSTGELCTRRSPSRCLMPPRTWHSSRCPSTPPSNLRVTKPGTSSSYRKSSGCRFPKPQPGPGISKKSVRFLHRAGPLPQQHFPGELLLAYSKTVPGSDHRVCAMKCRNGLMLRRNRK